MGVPLPIFINKKTQQPLKDKKVIDNIANIFEKEGSDCWFTDDASRFLGKEHNANEFEKLNDIVEVWFDSGSTHTFVLEKREDLKWPADMYLEGSDQHRGGFTPLCFNLVEQEVERLLIKYYHMGLLLTAKA